MAFTLRPPTLVHVGNMRRRYSTVTGRIKEKVVPVMREKRYLSRNKYDGKNKYPAGKHA